MITNILAIVTIVLLIVGTVGAIFIKVPLYEEDRTRDKKENIVISCYSTGIIFLFIMLIAAALNF